MSEAAPPQLSVQSPEALPAGTRVAEFEVRRLLGCGGFGMVYLAWDHALEREVALKEYMPGTLAGRGAGLQVSVRSSSTAETFAVGLRSFINEGRLLARFDHPSLVKVYRFWEDNGTAYMVMPYYPGRTLRQVREGMIVPPGDAVCRRVLDGLLSALETLHREGVYHRDVSPDNILLNDESLPVLLDFGAARRVLGDETQALTSILKPHYAPLEQYADGNTMRQGPWTDLYALGGTMYFLITGEKPVAAASRALHDDQPRLSATGSRDCSPALLAAIDWMLALKPPERPQSVHMLRDVLEGRITMPGRQAADKTVPGVAARETAAAHPPRTDIDLGTPDAAGAAVPSPDQSSAATVVQLPPSAAPSQAAAAPGAAAGVASAAAASAILTAVRRQSQAMLWLLGALVLLNFLAWWWIMRPAPTEPAALAASLAAPALAPSAPAAAASARATDAAGSETILSILPARNSAARGPESTDAPARASPAAATTPVAPAAATPGAATVPGAALGPRARCGDRNFLSLLICMKRECDQPALVAHPECVKMREQEDAQRDRRQ